jgi:hypothetical protein
MSPAAAEFHSSTTCWLHPFCASKDTRSVPQSKAQLAHKVTSRSHCQFCSCTKFLDVSGLRWGDMYSYCSYAPDISQQTPYDPRLKFRSYNCVFPLWQGYLTLLVQWAAYWCLAVYLSNVLPNEVRQAGGCRSCCMHCQAPAAEWPVHVAALTHCRVWPTPLCPLSAVLVWKRMLVPVVWQGLSHVCHRQRLPTEV